MGVEIASRVSGKRVSLTRTRRKARRILALLGMSRSELSLALVGDDEIRQLNGRYRRRHEPTDVLSFPIQEPLAPGSWLLGDVVISVERAERQAKSGGRTLEEEIDRLMIHGVLHLLGYDHERSPKEAGIMRRMERKISRELCAETGLKV